MYQSTTANTTVLGWWQFDDPFTGSCDPQGWTVKDMTAQEAVYFHVDGNDPLDPSCHGITPVNGQKSMWCGQWPSTGDPWCGWATLPGYGNGWEQLLVSDTLVCDTLSWSWTAVWDSEPGYDFTYVEYYDPTQSAYIALPVNGGAGYYDGTGGPQIEGHQIDLVSGPTGWTILRYRFVSDSGWSDEDGLWPTSEGAFKVDDITVSCQSGPTYLHDFESEPCGQTESNDGFWEAQMTPPFGTYAHLVPGAAVLQEDPCMRVISCVWAFFDDPAVTNYACGGHPLQGAVPYGPDENGLYMQNEIWSPAVPIVGSGNQFLLQFLVYRDLPLDALLFYIWGVRGLDASGCPDSWGDYGGSFGSIPRVLSGKFVTSICFRTTSPRTGR
jgi:hypothetical protein